VTSSHTWSASVHLLTPPCLSPSPLPSLAPPQDRPALAALQLAATAACAHHWGAWAREALDLPGLTSAGGRLGAALIHAWLDTVSGGQRVAAQRV
jgi:hypothetical protein